VNPFFTIDTLLPMVTSQVIGFSGQWIQMIETIGNRA